MTKQDAIEFIKNLPENIDISIATSERYISCSEVERLGISRQLLGYHVKLGNVRTKKEPGKYQKYLLEDVLRLK